MDESFAYFLTKFGPPNARRDVDPDYAKTCAGLLPSRLLQYWTEHGFSGYADGLFWTVDPRDYESVLEMWLAGSHLEGQDDYHVIARTAFGTLFVWGRESGSCLEINAAHALLFPKRSSRKLMEAGREDIVVQAFFTSLSRSGTDFSDEVGQPLFSRALEKLGPLSSDEMFGFEPALAFGGQAILENLSTVKIIPHLEILAQIGPRRILENPLLQS